MQGTVNKFREEEEIRAISIVYCKPQLMDSNMYGGGFVRAAVKRKKALSCFCLKILSTVVFAQPTSATTERRGTGTNSERTTTPFATKENFP